MRFWSVSKVVQGTGKVEVTGGAQQGGLLLKDIDLGFAAFTQEPGLPPARATASVLSTASGARYQVLAQAPSFNPFRRQSPKGAPDLDEYQAYEKRSGDASLRITISRVILDAIDDNGVLSPSECPSRLDCKPIRGVVRFHARAYAESAGGDFFDVGGAAYVEGFQGFWTIDAVTSSDSRAPL